MQCTGLDQSVSLLRRTGSGFEMQEHKLTDSKLTRDLVCVEGFEVLTPSCTDVCTLMQELTAA